MKKFILQEKQYTQLYKAFKISTENQSLFFDFLKDLLTPRELEDVLMRFEIIDRLNKHQQHRNIAEDLYIGIGTVTRGANELKDQDGGFNKILKKLYKK